jgi:hypothetical protein
MSLLTLPFRLPLLPLRATIRLAQVIQEEAERELSDPATVRRQLEDVERAEAAGDISGQQAAELEKQAVAEYTQARKDVAAEDHGEGY